MSFESVFDLLTADFILPGLSECSASLDEGVENTSFDVSASGYRQDAICDVEGLFLSLQQQILAISHQLAKTPSRRGDRYSSENQLGDGAQENAHKSCIQLPIANRRQLSTHDPVAKWRAIRYPRGSGGKAASSQSLAQALGVLDIMHESLLSDVVITKRDIYYRDVSLFKRQSVVDELVDDFAASFGMPRHALNVRATAKGLICGSAMTIELHNHQMLRCSDTEGVLIPAFEDIVDINLASDTAWVLLVEKDAVFQTLCCLGLTNHLEMPGRGLLITAKGYPDIFTRQLVKLLSDSLPRTVPIMALVDGDPYGIDIMSVYKFGSVSLSHDNKNLAASRVKWFGIALSDLQELGIGKDSLMPLTAADCRKITSMICRPRSLMPDKWKKELTHMLFNRRKAEIEIISSSRSEAGAHSLLQYITHKMHAFVDRRRALSYQKKL